MTADIILLRPRAVDTTPPRHQRCAQCDGEAMYLLQSGAIVCARCAAYQPLMWEVTGYHRAAPIAPAPKPLTQDMANAALIAALGRAHAANKVCWPGVVMEAARDLKPYVLAGLLDRNAAVIALAKAVGQSRKQVSLAIGGIWA